MSGPIRTAIMSFSTMSPKRMPASMRSRDDVGQVVVDHHIQPDIRVGRKGKPGPGPASRRTRSHCLVAVDGGRCRTASPAGRRTASTPEGGSLPVAGPVGEAPAAISPASAFAQAINVWPRSSTANAKNREAENVHEGFFPPRLSPGEPPRLVEAFPSCAPGVAAGRRPC